MVGISEFVIGIIVETLRSSGTTVDNTTNANQYNNHQYRNQQIDPPGPRSNTPGLGTLAYELVTLFAFTAVRALAEAVRTAA